MYTTQQINQLVEHVCQRIAPTWPLDNFIAVNPYWGRRDQSFEHVHQHLLSLTGAGLTRPLADYKQGWEQQHISKAALQQALDEAGLPTGQQHAIAALSQPAIQRLPAPLLSDMTAVTSRQTASTWPTVLTQQISQYCAMFFDQDQADWHPDKHQGLYQGWKQAVVHDHGLSNSMQAPHLHERARALPDDALSLIHHLLPRLFPDGKQAEQWLEALLLRINGWAAWCAYQRWQAHQQGNEDNSLVQLLAIRLAWESLLDDGERQSHSSWGQWQQAWKHHHSQPLHPGRDWALIWQRAAELTHQHQLRAQLRVAEGPRPGAKVQAVFCIDVRSEVFRHALETTAPDIHTSGFAGFFGLPAAYQPIATTTRQPQLPGLLAAQLTITDSTGSVEQDKSIAKYRTRQLAKQAQWQAFARLPASNFTLVESLGWNYLGKLFKRSLLAVSTPAHHQQGISTSYRQKLSPQLTGLSPQQQIELASRILHTMGMTQPQAQLLVLVGHHSQSSNNPHAAGLECGACGGHSGESNVRALAILLNTPTVREGLVHQGIQLAPNTLFLAALHNTSTEEVTLFTQDVPTHLPPGPELAHLQQSLARAGALTRQERATSIGLDITQLNRKSLFANMLSRVGNWAETRPEWGLTNNAAMIIAPRELTYQKPLNGRVFLHDYHTGQDTDGNVLEAIMTGGMVVAHWINMQYYASTVDNQHYGSGNKLLHNVVGGRIGVFEGNSGDLRIGLSRQSLHDGEQWRHTPLRLSVWIAAPAERIEAIVAKHPLLQQLIQHQWLYLFSLEHGKIQQLQGQPGEVVGASQ